MSEATRRFRPMRDGTRSKRARQRTTERRAARKARGRKQGS